jgi:hypothetical protein
MLWYPICTSVAPSMMKEDDLPLFYHFDRRPPIIHFYSSNSKYEIAFEKKILVSFEHQKHWDEVFVHYESGFHLHGMIFSCFTSFTARPLTMIRLNLFFQ